MLQGLEDSMHEFHQLLDAKSGDLQRVSSICAPKKTLEIRAVRLEKP